MNAKRGYVPDDDKNFSPEAIEKMRIASRHIRYLINEGYDLKQASTFVGNHFVFSERQRLAMVRSIATEVQLGNRRSKEKNNVSGSEVWIDGFNTIITLEVMLSDSILLDCMDGTIRDLGALRGNYRIIPETREASKVLLDALKDMDVALVHILLDKPVSNSGRLKTLVAEEGENTSFGLDIQVISEVDKTLWDKENVITSDSIILDHCKSWINLMKICAKARNAKRLRVWEISG